MSALLYERFDNTSKVFFERIKGRSFKKKLTFTLTVNDEDGNSYIDQGRFPIADKPTDGLSLGDHLAVKTGRPRNPREDEVKSEIRALKAQQKSNKEIAAQLDISQSTVKRYLQEMRGQTEIDF